MKKALALILTAAAMLSLSACPASVKPEETFISDTSFETTKAPETTTTSTPEPVESSTVEETPSSTPEETSGSTIIVTPVPKPKVKVTNAVSKTFKNGGTKYKYQIPKVTISGKSTSAANKKIKKQLIKYSYKGSEPYAMKYRYFINNKIVSILVHIQNAVYDADMDCIAYNISVKTGKLIKDKAVLKLCGISSKKFFKMVKSTYKKVGGIWLKTGSEAKKCVKRNLKRVSFKHIDPYLGANGHLCFVGYVSYWGGMGEGNISFDAVKKAVD